MSKLFTEMLAEMRLLSLGNIRKSDINDAEMQEPEEDEDDVQFKLALSKYKGSTSSETDEPTMTGSPSDLFGGPDGDTESDFGDPTDPTADPQGGEMAGEIDPEMDPNADPEADPEAGLDGEEDPLADPEAGLEGGMGDEMGGENDPNRQGTIRTVKGAHLVYKRQEGDGTFKELWIFGSGEHIDDAISVKKAIIAGTDIPENKMRSEDGEQSYELVSMGNAQLLAITGLKN